MNIDDNTIDHLAKLSRLAFTQEQKEQIKSDLQNILNLVDKLGELNTEGVEPLIHMTEHVNVLRDDVVKESITREEALRNAPKKDSDYFKVPKVIAQPSQSQ
ncbi:MAG: Asp-tRNA(Asn)/Glu-tRNA(Gln) amidotransferase subunit GatC [Cryomorphaceae bacterium]|nr:MAG: Asp-tRNA(Asn)/Glu-tRNA(Gln) amidotransferase subunit GatC [Cryomorphaceae bacterium]